AHGPVGPRQRSVHAPRPRCADPEQLLEEAPSGRRRRIRAILRTAITLAERDQDRTALCLPVGAVALHALELAHEAVEVRPHLLDLVVDRAALRRLAAEKGEEAAALATGPAGLLST